jgi:hypothetical protein
MRKWMAGVLLAGFFALPGGVTGQEIPVLAPIQGSAADISESPAVTENLQESSPGPRLFFSTEYILWWLREGRLPATLTTSPQSSQGLIGQPGTQVLYGDDRLETRHDDRFNGLRLTLGYWFDDAQSFGIEGNAFFLERDSTYFKATSDGSTLLARPYLNPDGSAASYIIAGLAPSGLQSGAFVGYSRIQLYGQEANVVLSLIKSDAFRLEALAGARFLEMQDRTELTSSGSLLSDPAILFGVTDQYKTSNAYYGGQAGLRGEWTSGRWSLEFRGEIGAGVNDEQVRAFGSTTYATPFERIVTPTGLTVQASNTGTFDKTAVNTVSELDANLAYQITPHFQLFAGYTAIIWDGALRSGDQIDPVVNTSPGTPPARPMIPFKEDLFWAQGLNAGLRFSW